MDSVLFFVTNNFLESIKQRSCLLRQQMSKYSRCSSGHCALCDSPINTLNSQAIKAKDIANFQVKNVILGLLTEPENATRTN